MVKNRSRLHQRHYTRPRRVPLWTLGQSIFQEPPALHTLPTLSPLFSPLLTYLQYQPLDLGLAPLFKRLV